MSTIYRRLVSAPKNINPIPAWLAGNREKWASWTLIAIVIAYVGFLIITPLVALTLGAFEKGVGAIFEAFDRSFVLASFWNTLWISLVVVTIHAIFGTIVAWVLVRHRFPGRDLINGLIDMPFAVSPVVAGYMLLLLFGRNGLLAPFVEATGIQVAFAFPGM
ncbi:MAG: sulfate ABC transporter permease subunit CysW, partial [Chloroflexi bacterium]